MARVVFVGAYAYAREVLEALPEDPVAIVTEGPGEPRWQQVTDIPSSHSFTFITDDMKNLDGMPIDLVIVAGWRRMVPIIAPTVGFHSAKLPEYPGRAPVANAILRGDDWLTNTMLWLDEGIDTGDIIDETTFDIGDDPDEIYRMVGLTSALMLQENWDGLLDGTAPRMPQDMSRRGPLTPADAWDKLAMKQPAWIEAFG